MQEPSRAVKVLRFPEQVSFPFLLALAFLNDKMWLNVAQEMFQESFFI